MYVKQIKVVYMFIQGLSNPYYLCHRKPYYDSRYYAQICYRLYIASYMPCFHLEHHPPYCTNSIQYRLFVVVHSYSLINTE